MLANLKLAGVSLALFGFLAAMAWTGKLAQIDGFKVRIFAWIVEDLAVGTFGRIGAAILFAGIGLLASAAILGLAVSPAAQEETHR